MFLRSALAVAAGVVVATMVASPAWAHTEIEIDNPVGGATNVTMSVTSEAENPAAGIASVRMQLPAGISPAQVSLLTGPAGWTLTTTSDGFTVAGAPLAKGTDATFAVKIARLPAAGGVLFFKTLVTYTDGKVDHWIEEPTAANPTPQEPAPSVSVPAGATVAAPAPSVEATTPATTPAAAKSSGGAGVAWLVGLGALVLVAAAAAVVAVRRRRAT